MEEGERLQKTMLKIFQKELQPLDPELQSMLIDDIVTAFYNRLNIMKKIKHNKEMHLYTNDSLVPEDMQTVDPDTLQLKDETNKKWVRDWKKEVSKL
ncbi:MAG: hypothetical protein PVH73_02900 [Candidatus Bathyarchaeota archaeon]